MHARSIYSFVSVIFASLFVHACVHAYALCASQYEGLSVLQFVLVGLHCLCMDLCLHLCVHMCVRDACVRVGLLVWGDDPPKIMRGVRRDRDCRGLLEHRSST